MCLQAKYLMHGAYDNAKVHDIMTVDLTFQLFQDVHPTACAM